METEQQNKNNSYLVDQFDDFKILTYRFDEFSKLPIEKKKLVYYLSNAAIAGRDIIYDQNYKYNLRIRKSLEIIFESYTGDRNNQEFIQFHNFLKKVWFSNGIHHPYSKEKLKPAFKKEFLHDAISKTFDKGLHALFSSAQEAVDQLTELIFNPEVAPQGVVQEPGKDMVRQSAVNFYENIGQEEVENYYNKLYNENPKLPHGLNTKITRVDGRIKEITWYENGLYGEAIKQVVYWLEKALSYTENSKQQTWLKALIDYYKSGNLEAFNQYNIAWVNDTASAVDLINGFIETYSDPLGMKGTWESILHVQDTEATKRTKILSQNAQWFEDHAPINERFKKEKVTGVSATVVNVAMLGGESHPTSPIGVNLPNADWIRKEHGSKSITLNNISRAHHEAMGESGFIEEFAYSEAEVKRHKKYAFLANNLHTDLHECLGHGSGKLMEGIKSEMLKNYQAPIEEARADLFALYYMMDPKLQELGIIPSEEAAHAQYDSYIRNGLMTQLIKVEEGKNLEQAHMRNRQLIAKWSYEKGAEKKIIDRIIKEGKTYFVIHDYKKLQELFGQLLAEIQRIKSEGDFELAKYLVDLYGTQIDENIHKEVIKRFKKLNIPPFTGFLNPEYRVITNKTNEIEDIKITYPKNYSEQMLFYSKNYSFLSVDK